MKKAGKTYLAFLLKIQVIKGFESRQSMLEINIEINKCFTIAPQHQNWQQTSLQIKLKEIYGSDIFHILFTHKIHIILILNHGLQQETSSMRS